MLGAIVLLVGLADAPAEGATSEPHPSPYPQESGSVTATPHATPTPDLGQVLEPSPNPEPSAPAVESMQRGEPDSDALVNSQLDRATATGAMEPRLAGADRFATSTAAARAAFPDGAATVLIASGYSPADGIIAAGIAATQGAPLLYVNQSSVPDGVAAEVARLGPESIIVVGGEPSVSSAVFESLRALAPDVRRFGGVNRYETSRMALVDRTTPAPTVYLSNGANLVDAPFASVAAAATGNGALLVDGVAPAVDAATLDALRDVGANSLVLAGGLTNIGAAYEQSLRSAGFTLTRRAGADRHETAVLMSRERTEPAERAIVANSMSAPDVSVAAALAAASGQALFYALKPCMPDVVSATVEAAALAVTAVGGPEWLGAAVLANRSCTTERLASQTSLNSEIRATLAQYPGSFSVSVRQWGGLDAVTDIGGAIRREPASMMKLFAAWAALKKIESGAAGFSTMLPSGVDLNNCLHVMIHASDNYCHSDIVHWIGIGQLNRMIADAGFPNTSYGTVPNGASVLYAGNRSTTNDLVGMLEKLTAGTALSRPYADHLLSLMGIQIFRTRIASGIPPGVAQVSKPGALWLASGLLQADTAIVYSPAGPYMISMIGDAGPPQAALRAVSRTVYEHFNGPFGAAMVYPAQQMATVRATALRTSPGGAMTVVVPAGTPIQVNDANRTWYKVQWGNGELWATVHDLRNR